MSKKSLTILLASLVAVVFAAPAQAVLVQANGTAVFYDDFEGPAVSDPPDNGAYPGDWTQTGLGKVVNQANNPASAPAYEGLQMMRWNGATGSFGATKGAFSSVLGTGDTLHAEMAVWILSSDLSYSFGFDLRDSNDSSVALGFYRTVGDGGGIRNSISGNNYTLLSWQNGWNVLEVDYVLGSTDLTYTLNGTSDTRGTPAISEIAAIVFREGGAGVSSDFMVDAAGPIPEGGSRQSSTRGARFAGPCSTWPAGYGTMAPWPGVPDPTPPGRSPGPPQRQEHLRAGRHERRRPCAEAPHDGFPTEP